jgi:flagella synthesis protein FlgN
LEHYLPEMIFDPAHSINAECEATRNFIEILRREQLALRQADVSMLLPLAHEKAQQAQQLAELSGARKRWLSTQGLAPDRSGVEDELQNFAGASEAWQEFTQLAETARQLNEINGNLVGQRLRYNQQAIAALQEATHVTGVYGCDGHTQPFAGGRQLGEV